MIFPAARRFLTAGALATAMVAPALALGGPWPGSSEHPVRPLGHPSVPERAAALALDPAAGYRFAAFGDQRALAGGEWQELMMHLGRRAGEDRQLLFMIDTGDIVQDGSHSDQFRTLEGILEPASSLPYLVGVGNHEVDNNRPGPARPNTAAFLAPLDSGLTPDRIHYAAEIGPARFLFLDTSDLVYGDRGEGGGSEPAAGSRAEAQMAWLVSTLQSGDPEDLVIAVLHHPLLQTSSKHRSQSRRLWSYRYRGRTLPDLLADGGVDVILSGHTHTYERFRVRRSDGRGFALVNLSGRPKNSFLFFGAGSRRAKDIAGEEASWFAKRGWDGLDRWTISQEEAMVRDEADQFGLFTVQGDGGLLLRVHYLDDDTPRGLRPGPEVRLR